MEVPRNQNLKVSPSKLLMCRMLYVSVTHSIVLGHQLALDTVHSACSTADPQGTRVLCQ